MKTMVDLDLAIEAGDGGANFVAGIEGNTLDDNSLCRATVSKRIQTK
jgi:hypothetical protein